MPGKSGRRFEDLQLLLVLPDHRNRRLGIGIRAHRTHLDRSPPFLRRRDQHRGRRCSDLDALVISLLAVATLGDLLSRLDPDPLRRGKQFEHICKWFLTNDPAYSHQLRRVWLWDEWPGRWGGDAGIDWSLRTDDGHLWAIQAKAYDAAYRVTKSDVDKFLAESGRKIFSYRLLIATTDLIDRIGERTIAGSGEASGFLLG